MQAVKRRLRRLSSQLTLIFLAGFLGIGIAIGVPIVLLISQQASSHAQLLLDQAMVAARVFIEREKADLQSLALVFSQRPTLIRILHEQDFSSLEGYLDTLQEGANVDLILICSGQEKITAFDQDRNDLCQLDTQTGYAALSSSDTVYMYATAEVSFGGESPYRVITGKYVSSILTDLQKETGLLYFLLRQDQAIFASDPGVEVTPTLSSGLLQGAVDNIGESLQQRSFPIAGRRYILANQQIDPSWQLNLVSALNVDDQIAVQQNLIRTLIVGLFLIVFIASALGVWLSRRISRPIVHLADAAAEFRQGNLDAPISIQSSIREIDQLTNTLEDGRIALRHSLQQLQAEKAWIEHLLNSIIEGMLTLNHENRITFASAGIGKITGADTDKLIGQKINDVFLPLEGEVDLSSQLPAAGQQRRISVKLKNGQERLLSISKSELIPPQASDANRALVIRDVSNEEYIHRLLGDFMANITHEFRTPLAALEASTELLLDNVHNLSQAEIEELLVSLNLGIINLQTLIDNLIEAASIEAGRFKVSLQPVSFGRIMQEAVDIIQPLADKYALKLISQRVEESLLVMADQRRMVQALVNLLSNAVKHSPEHGSIYIRNEAMGGQLRVEVIDEGGGVPLGQRGNLFRRFAHLETANERARQGAGLGLSVVKEIVEAHQGEVGITERPEGGTSFWLTLPLVSERVEE
ncbi:MAG TPA: ATP-binding protein [Anaerolineales bacterium]|nr:ATP-binding protein [Anaerolineales bacterium]